MVPLTYVRADRPRGRAAAADRAHAGRPRRPHPLLDLLDGVLITGGADLAAETYGAAAACGERRRPTPTATPSRSRSCARRASATCPASASAAACRSSTWPTAARSSSTCPTGWRTTSTAAPAASSPTTTSRSSRAASRRSPPATRGSPCARYHHQGVERVGDGLRVTARAEGDATVEGDRGPEPPLHARRALAPRGGRGRPADRRVRAGVPGPRRRAEARRWAWRRASSSAGEARARRLGAQRRNVSGRRRAAVPLSAENVTRATTR